MLGVFRFQIRDAGNAYYAFPAMRRLVIMRNVNDALPCHLMIDDCAERVIRVPYDAVIGHLCGAHTMRSLQNKNPEEIPREIFSS